jgi:hypothetical protein
LLALPRRLDDALWALLCDGREFTVDKPVLGRRDETGRS